MSISKDASNIVVGADGHDLNTDVQDSGAVYLFQIVNATTTTATVEWLANLMQLFLASSTPMPTQKSPQPEKSNLDAQTIFSPGVIVAAIVVVGGVAALIAILNYRIKIKRQERDHQQQEDAPMYTGDGVLLLHPSASSNIPASVPASAENETHLTAVVLMPDGTMEAGADENYKTKKMVQTNHLDRHSHSIDPNYKDQVGP